MKNTNRQRRKGWIVIVSAIVICIALLLWLEWLGSEQPLKVMEQPLELPDTTKATASKTG